MGGVHLHATYTSVQRGTGRRHSIAVADCHGGSLCGRVEAIRAWEITISGLLFAIGLTLIAGLATGIGAAVVLSVGKISARFLAASLGFSAGVMIYVAMIELMATAQVTLTGTLGRVTGSWVAVAGFFGGIALIAVIDHFVPEDLNPHELAQDDADLAKARLMRTGLMTAVALAIHNFPEGFATFVSALEDPKLGIPIAVAIAIHNMPEGIAVALPIRAATGSRAKAFWYAFLSGLAEPAGALIGYLLLRPFLSDTLMGVVLAGVAGIMVFISLDELLPTAEQFGEHHLAIYGVVAGMAVMAVSLVLFI